MLEGGSDVAGVWRRTLGSINEGPGTDVQDGPARVMDRQTAGLRGARL